MKTNKKVKIVRLNIEIEESYRLELKKRALFKNIPLSKYIHDAIATYIIQEDLHKNK